MALKFHKTSIPSVGDTVSEVNYNLQGDYVSLKFSSGRVIGVPVAKEYTKEEIKQLIMQYVKQNQPIPPMRLKELMRPLDIKEADRRTQVLYLIESGQIYVDAKFNFNACRRRYSRKSKRS